MKSSKPKTIREVLEELTGFINPMDVDYEDRIDQALKEIKQILLEWFFTKVPANYDFTNPEHREEMKRRIEEL